MSPGNYSKESSRAAAAAPQRAPPLIFQNIQLASPEGIGNGEHEEFSERDTLDQEKRPVSAEYP